MGKEKPSQITEKQVVEMISDFEVSDRKMIADIYISISTGTFDIENIKYEKKLATVRFRYIL